MPSTAVKSLCPISWTNSAISSGRVHLKHESRLRYELVSLGHALRGNCPCPALIVLEASEPGMPSAFSQQFSTCVCAPISPQAASQLRPLTLHPVSRVSEALQILPLVIWNPLFRPPCSSKPVCQTPSIYYRSWKLFCHVFPHPDSIKSDIK